MMKIKPIGIIRSPFKTKAECPPQGDETISEIEIFKEYKQGLKDVEGFSHLHIFYWMHESNGYSLSVVTPWDTKPHGLFAVRTPNRPNPLGYAVVELLEKNKNILKVRGLDAVEGTPIVDIKPYISKIDAKTNIIDGWVKGKYSTRKTEIENNEDLIK